MGVQCRPKEDRLGAYHQLQFPPQEQRGHVVFGGSQKKANTLETKEGPLSPGGVPPEGIHPEGQTGEAEKTSPTYPEGKRWRDNYSGRES